MRRLKENARQVFSFIHSVPLLSRLINCAKSLSRSAWLNVFVEASGIVFTLVWFKGAKTKNTHMTLRRRVIWIKIELNNNVYFLPVILNTLVPQSGHTPDNAFIPFLRTTSFSSFISTCFLHFMHLPCAIFCLLGFIVSLLNRSNPDECIEIFIKNLYTVYESG